MQGWLSRVDARVSVAAAKQLQPIWSQLVREGRALRGLASSARSDRIADLLSDIGLETPKELNA